MSEPKKRNLFDVLSLAGNIFFSMVSLVFLLSFVGGCIAFISFMDEGSISPMKDHVEEDSILALKLEGLIFKRTKLLEDLHKYIKNKKIKGVLLRVDSPGGDLASTQEIHKEIHRLKEKYKKPIVVSIGSMAASGGFYVAMAGDKIVANEGSLLGSIGVVIFTSNYEKLYEWAKIENHVIKTGEFKDSLSPHRAMTNRERDLFQDLLDQSLDQFKAVIIKDRKLSSELVNDFSDARIFLGDTALVQGFIDQTGTYYDALELAGELSGLGEDPAVFEPPKKTKNWPHLVFDIAFKNIFPLKYLKSKGLPFILRSSEWQGRPLYLSSELIGF